MKTIEKVYLEIPLDGMVHVFFFTGTEEGKIKFARIAGVDKIRPFDQIDAALHELGIDRYEY